MESKKQSKAFRTMKGFSPTFLNGILLAAGGIRFLDEPVGFALVLLGVGVVLFELPSLYRSFQR